MTSRLLIAAGLAAVLFAILADVAGFSLPGWGITQATLGIGGASAAWAGIWLSARGRQWIAQGSAADVSLRPLSCVGLAVWFGLATGVLEVAHQAVRHFLFGVVIRQPAEIMWMAPLSFALLFLLFGIGWAVLARIWPAVVVTPVVVFFCAVVAVWSQTLLHSRVGAEAGFVLAVGVAAQLARVSARRDVMRFTRRTGPVIAGAVILSAFALPLGRAFSERRAIESLPAVDAASAQNVLLIVLDTVRADHLAMYGYERDTMPHLERRAQQGVVFEWPIIPCSWTLPSHAIMFTGRYHHELSVGWRAPLDGTHDTLAEVLSGNGYATAGFVGNIARCERGWGVARASRTTRTSSSSPPRSR